MNSNSEIPFANLIDSKFSHNVHDKHNANRLNRKTPIRSKAKLLKSYANDYGNDRKNKQTLEYFRPENLADRTEERLKFVRCQFFVLRQ